MKCPNCQHENPDEAKFCIECGNPIEFQCPKCGAKTPRTSKFCMECGHNLTQPSEPPLKELSFDEKIRKIQKYLPKGLTEKILSERDRIEGERKHVTVMFCDMEGFTYLVDKLGPEEAYSIMDEVYEILIHKVHDYEGTVNEMTGDGIMALFGAPIALEDAPQRAIRSAYAIHREMTGFSDKIKQERGGILPLKMRVGIHTGPVVVGTLGNDLRVEFKAVGDTVNLASRMEDLAEPGATYVTEETFKLTEGFFRYESLGEKEVKGKEEPIKAYCVIGPSTRRTRFDVSAERGLTPFVGRERELELLLDGFERAKQGRGQAFSIIAEAGVGKSRLLYEFRKAVVNEDAIFFEGKCLSYSRSMAYHPVIDILKSTFDIREFDGDIDITEKVKRNLKVFSVDEASTLPYLLELLGVKDSGINKIPMSSEARKDRIMEAVKLITLKGSEIRPLIIAYEDLHWIDKSSEEHLKDLLDSIAGARVLLIFTYRPEFVHTWGGKSFHSQVNLNRLPNRESLAMVTYLLGTEEIETQLEELILEKTEGVPFFIEEFIKSLLDIKAVERRDNRYHLKKDIKDVTIPSTIHDVIMARVDSLPEGAKEVLQTGSVIEREFSYELTKQITGISQDDLLSHMSVLKDSELIYERGIYPQSTYIFKHALTREVIYDSILTRRRKKLHVDIANAIEEVYKDNIKEYYEILAEHYIAGENYEKGAEYSILANKKAEKTASFPDAIAYAKKGINCLEKLPQKKDILKKLIDARTTLGLYWLQLTHIFEAKEAVDPIADLVIKLKYKKRISQIYTIIGTYNFTIEQDLPVAFQNLEEALKISEEIKDTVSSVFVNLYLGIALLYNCEFKKASYHLKKALDINVAANNIWGISVMKSVISVIYNFEGKIDLGYQTSDEALCVAEESGDIWSKSTAHIYHGLSYLFKGFFENVREHFLEGINLGEKINYNNLNAMAHHLLGKYHFEKKEYQKSVDYYEKAIQISEGSVVHLNSVNLLKILIARSKVMNNEKNVDLESLYRYEAEDRVRVFEGWMRRYIGEILLNIDDQHMNEAEEWIKKAIETNKRNGTMWNLGKDYALYAELLKRKGDQSKAKENLNKAIEILKECGADGWVEKYEKELASL